MCSSLLYRANLLYGCGFTTFRHSRRRWSLPLLDSRSMLWQGIVVLWTLAQVDFNFEPMDRA